MTCQSCGGASENFEIKQGDLEPDLELELSDERGIIDLTLADVVTLRWTTPETGTRNEREVAITDAKAGLVKLVWEAGDTDEIGIYEAEAIITWANFEDQTLPSDGFYSWTVNPHL